MVAIKVVKNAFKGAYVGVFALFDSLFISYPQHFKQRWKGPSKAYKVIKVPKGYVDRKLEPEYKEVPSSGYSSSSKDGNTAAGFAGLNF
jgi:hypothetical protein